MQIDKIVKGYQALKFPFHQAIAVNLDKMIIYSKLLEGVLEFVISQVWGFLVTKLQCKFS